MEGVPNAAASTQERFITDVLRNRNVASILQRWNELDLPDAWIVAGCLFQTIWNCTSGKEPESNIKDYDIFYFDPDDLSKEAESAAQRKADMLFNDLSISLEVCNQARVHQWYEDDFGYAYPQLSNAKEGIDRFLIPSTCIGMNPKDVYAPNGIDLIYAGVLSLNPLTPHQDLYEQKASSYQQRWPWLRRED